MSKILPLSYMLFGALISTAIIAPVYAQHHDMMKQHHGSPSDMMHSCMDTMSHNMRSMKMTGDTDHDFAMMMAEHHQGAIQMAEIEVKSGKDSALRSMAKMMIEAQKKERAQLLKHAKMKH